MGGVWDLFSQTTRIDKRDTSTVRRAKLDDGVYDSMKERAELFRGAVERVPELHLDDAEPEGEGGGEGDEAGSSEYVPHWDDLMGDVFKSLHTHEDPGVLDQSKIKPSREVNRRVMQHVLGTEEFSKARPMTKDAEVEAAFATMGLAEELRETLQSEMSDLAEEAKNAEKQEQTIERQEERAEEIREQVREQEGQISPEQQAALDDAVKRKSNARQRLQQSMESMEGMPVTVAAAQGIQEAAKQAREDAKLFVSIPGLGKGEKQQLSPDEAIRLAQMFKDNPHLMKVAEMVGRILRDMRFKRARRITGGTEEVVDVGMGNDLERVLPAEKMKLMDPLQELDFMRRFVERSLLQYEYQGTAEAGFGPLIICRDESSSMSGQKNVWAGAVTLALISIARKEKRDAAVIAYSSSSQQETWLFPFAEPFNPDKVVEMAGHFFSGGTDATPALGEAVGITQGNFVYTKADLVLISDGEDRYQDDDKRLRDELKARGVRLHGVMIGASPSRYLTEMCETLVSAYDLAGANDATDMLAAHIS